MEGILQNVGRKQDDEMNLREECEKFRLLVSSEHLSQVRDSSSVPDQQEVSVSPS